jgi:hypothetical protein
VEELRRAECEVFRQIAFQRQLSAFRTPLARDFIAKRFSGEASAVSEKHILLGNRFFRITVYFEGVADSITLILVLRSLVSVFPRMATSLPVCTLAALQTFG